jgi:hypothetical protein
VGDTADQLDLTIPATERVALANARHLAACAPDVRPMGEAFLVEMLRLGHPMGFVQSVRLDEDQFILFRKGRQLIRGVWHVVDEDLVVTQARTARESAHGCICGVVHKPGDGCARALDFCFLIDGKVVGPKPGKGNDSYDLDLPWQLAGEVAERIGWQWGGRFTKPAGDLGHLQQKNWKALREAAVRERESRRRLT